MLVLATFSLSIAVGLDKQTFLQPYSDAISLKEGGEPTIMKRRPEIGEIFGKSVPTRQEIDEAKDKEGGFADYAKGALGTIGTDASAAVGSELILDEIRDDDSNDDSNMLVKNLLKSQQAILAQLAAQVGQLRKDLDEEKAKALRAQLGRAVGQAEKFKDQLIEEATQQLNKFKYDLVRQAVALKDAKDKFKDGLVESGEKRVIAVKTEIKTIAKRMISFTTETTKLLKTTAVEGLEKFKNTLDRTLEFLKKTTVAAGQGAVDLKNKAAAGIVAAGKGTAEGFVAVGKGTKKLGKGIVTGIRALGNKAVARMRATKDNMAAGITKRFSKNWWLVIRPVNNIVEKIGKLNDEAQELLAQELLKKKLVAANFCKAEKED